MRTYMLAAAIAAAASAGNAVPVDLSSWTAQGNGNWVLQPGNNAVRQTLNNDPTVFFGPGNAQGNQLSGTIEVQTVGDDDFIGFVLGFQSGDLTAAATDFLVIDWKQSNQGGFFGCTALAGLAISHVSAGLPTSNRGAWCHDADGVTELARATNLGATGWADNREYTFDLVFTASNVQVFVDGVKEIDINGTFADGAFGFYNYSQAQVLYAGITEDVLPPPGGVVPEPSTWAMLIVGFGIAGAAARRRRVRVAQQ